VLVTITDKCDFVPHQVILYVIIKPSSINICLDVVLNLISLLYHCNFFHSSWDCINLIKRLNQLNQCIYILLFVGYNTVKDFCWCCFYKDGNCCYL